MAQQKKIKIAHVVRRLDMGGLQTLVFDIVRATDSSRFETMVFCLTHRGMLARQIRNLGIPVLCLADGEENRNLRFALSLRLARMLYLNGIDVVNCHNTAAYIYGGLAAILAGFKKMIYIDHGRPHPDTRSNIMAEWLLSWLTRRIVVVSEDLKQCLIRYEKISPSKIQVIPNGVDVEKFKRAEHGGQRAEKRKEFGIGENDIVIGTAARFEPVKDIATLVRAFALLKKKIERRAERPGRAYRLVLAGSGSELDNLKALCLELELQIIRDRHELILPDSQAGFSGPDSRFSVLFLGIRTDIPELMNTMDVFVMPSKSEGMPLAVLEAMACGVPVAATRVGGTPEIIRDDSTGVLFEPGNPEALADVLFGMITRPPDRSGQRPFPFSLDNMVRQYEQLWEKINNS